MDAKYQYKLKTKLTCSFLKLPITSKNEFYEKNKHWGKKWKIKKDKTIPGTLYFAKLKNSVI